MSFVSLIEKSDKFQLLEVMLGGITYLLVMPGKSALQLVKRHEETGVINIDKKHILWNGEGVIPEELNMALDASNLTKAMNKNHKT